jgi:hypothetical protein
MTILFSEKWLVPVLFSLAGACLNKTQVNIISSFGFSEIKNDVDLFLSTWQIVTI